MLRTSVQRIAVEMVWTPNGMIEPEDARVVIALLREQQGEELSVRDELLLQHTLRRTGLA